MGEWRLHVLAIEDDSHLPFALALASALNPRSSPSCRCVACSNIDFDEDEDARSGISAKSAPFLVAAERQLGCVDLALNLTTKESARRSLGMLPLSRAHAQDTRDAAIKEVYVQLFHTIVRSVNDAIVGSPGATSLPYMGLLDIFGFENFTHNSFEQVRTLAFLEHAYTYACM